MHEIPDRDKYKHHPVDKYFEMRNQFVCGWSNLYTVSMS